MEYDHGKRITPHYFEMSPLERAISSFESKAKAYYCKLTGCPEAETAEQRSRRENELAVALTHLKHERLRALTQIQVQCRLDEYRAVARTGNEGSRADRKEARAILAAEPHHPAQKLANFMRMDGRPQPGPRFTPHHLVQGKGKRNEAYMARVELHMAGIGINDADNGVWMPRTRQDKGHWAYPKAAAHCELHTLNYERWVYQNVQYKAGETAMRAALMMLRAHLKSGTQPMEVTQKPNPDWSGR